ncbi:MAG: PAS domain-containing protein [Anaerolineae bacterium]|nr:PAS domain-containing protein [Anaerolineae bacterium]
MADTNTQPQQAEQAELVAQRTRQQLQDMFDNTPATVYAKDLEGRYIFVNRQFRERSGMGEQQVLGKTQGELFPHLVGDIGGVWDQQEQDVLASGQTMSFEEVGRTTGRTYLAIKFFLYDADGNPYALCNSSIDITDRKQVEEEVKRRNRDLLLLNRVIAAATSTLDVKEVLTVACHELGQAFDIPQVAAALFNTECTAAVVTAEYLAAGRPSAMGIELPIEANPATQYVTEHKKPLAVANAQHDSRLAAVQHVMVQRGTASLLLLPLIVQERVIGTIGLDAIHPRDFSDREVELASSVAAAVSQALHNAQLYQELTTRRDALEQAVSERTAELQASNRQLEQANKDLLALSRVKTEFVSNVSHELQTPITNLKLRFHLLERDPDRADQHLKVLRRETNRLAHIIEDLLNLSRIDQDRLAYTPTAVDLNTLIYLYGDDRQLLAQNRELTLTCINCPDAPMVQADAGLFGQAVSILLTNALNYTPSGGAVMIRVETREHAGRQWAGIAIEDTGPGILPDELPHLFERFYRGTTGRESGTPGTGLGLAILKEIMDRHQGDIEVHSAGIPGQGATFRLWLPVPQP